MGFECEVLPNPAAEPRAVPHRASASRTRRCRPCFTYGHGDVIRGQDAQWREGLSPWKVTVEGDRIYGRGTADNKGQHTINLAALETVMRERGGKLGFNLKVLHRDRRGGGLPGPEGVLRSSTRRSCAPTC